MIAGKPGPLACALLAATLFGCGAGEVEGDDVDGGAGVDATGADAGDPGPLGFIGSPCAEVGECDYDQAVCLTEEFPDGSCSQPCDQYCPDRDGYPETFCVVADELPDSAAALGDGACLSRCDFGIFPRSGCRDGYGCVTAHRANDPDTQVYVCMPGAETELSDCYYDLAARGVAFEPTLVADQSPSTNPELTCHVEDPLYVLSPVHGVALVTSSGTETTRVLASCAMAHALTSTIDDVAPFDVVALEHMGTYNCRVIAGTSTLSRHAYGDAIDIHGFRFDDGTIYTVVDDWEHDTDDPQSEGGIFLYDAAHRWFDAFIWTIILTPNYNADHDDHFHVDLTPDSHYLGFTGGRYIGPAPYDD